MHVRRSRVLAALVGGWLVIAGVLGVRHEAQVAHVVDAAGRVHHAQRLDGHHSANTQSDIHGVAQRDGDTDVCALSVALHQAARAEAAHALAPVPHVELVVVALQARSSTALRDVYRFAPKTSPPHA